jgi:7-carboxy-7-deazaguanine synthase
MDGWLIRRYINLAVFYNMLKEYSDRVWDAVPGRNCWYIGLVMKVNEIFLSVQGEGRLTGHPTVFVRLAGCNLECQWCDTEYARDPVDGDDMSVDDIVAKVSEHGVRDVCITGGEPLLQDIKPLLGRLLDQGLRVSVETNGTQPINHLVALQGVVVSMDIKCPSSGMSEKNMFENLSKLRDRDQLKFVIKDDRDFDFAKQVLEEHEVACMVIFQPVWGTDPRWMVKRVLDEGLARYGVRVMVQLHKVLWGDRRGV